MLSVNINNAIIEQFYKTECNGNSDKFIEKLADYIENYNIKKSIQTGLKEIKLQDLGVLEKKEFKDILNEI